MATKEPGMDAAPKKTIFDLSLLVLHSVKNVNENLGCDRKAVEQFIWEGYDVPLDKEMFGTAVHTILKKGLRMGIICERTAKYRICHSVVLPPLPTGPVTAKVDFESLRPRLRRMRSGAKSRKSGPKSAKARARKVEIQFEYSEDSNDGDVEDEGDDD